MTTLIEERAYHSPTEQGHCKCCCMKWKAVLVPAKKTMRRTYGPKFKLVYAPRRRCTCYEEHKP